ncbi:MULTISPECIES: hypothetical protein [Klebsiella]|uniref:hypothetical protein n=1 Tax=Klebsiella TaxID=570 RepID=UPI000FF8E2D2|nr:MULTISPECIES: hypothetical protein [Klebsiella]QAS64430.1 hypothetical protein KOCBH_01873 [Klebsiella michiganensis]HCD5323628.1 hypothetical protein [Klebsiella michiganensis]HCD7245387.1 hypothetical protein [Klebsiella michiganensis]HCD7468486.1 hypothetical protein [Klebsiella michiganensis]HCD7474707.1 hypothetical protein [Klebsiella michiganensis]
MTTSNKEEKKKPQKTYLTLPDETYRILLKEARRNDMLLSDYLIDIATNKALSLKINK